jgi:hypothetical protein
MSLIMNLTIDNKFNFSAIMTAAHARLREWRAAGLTRTTFSDCLRAIWKQAKAERIEAQWTPELKTRVYWLADTVHSAYYADRLDDSEPSRSASARAELHQLGASHFLQFAA